MKVIGLLLALIQFTWISHAYFKGPNALSFDNAQAYCQGYGTTLATIETVTEWNRAKTACNGATCYIGLQDEINGDNDMIWSWSDGTDIASDYGFNADRTATTGVAPWNSGEPNEYLGTDEDCVEMYDTGLYNDIICSDANYPLCNSQYFRGTSAMSYTNAVQYCEDNFGSIASIETEDDWEEAVLVANGYNVWVGLQDEINGDNDMIWSWTDGTSTASNYGFNSDRTATTGEGPWNSGEPNEYQGSDEDCVEMYNTGFYNDVSCSDSNYPLCKVTGYPTLNPTPEPTLIPSKEPTTNPSRNPTLNPTPVPTKEPTAIPTEAKESTTNPTTKEPTSSHVIVDTTSHVIDPSTVPRHNRQDDDNKQLSLVEYIIITAATTAFVSICCMSIVCCICCQRKRRIPREGRERIGSEEQEEGLDFNQPQITAQYPSTQSITGVGQVQEIALQPIPKAFAQKRPNPYMPLNEENEIQQNED